MPNMMIPKITRRKFGYFPAGEGGPFMVEGVLAAGGPPMAVDEESLTFVTTHPSARQYLI